MFLAPVLALISAIGLHGACGLVDRLDVQMLLGRGVEAGVEEQTAGGSSCGYSVRTGRIEISVQRLSADLDLAAELGNLRAAAPGADLKEITLDGARAFTLDLHEDGLQLHAILQGRDYLMISVLGCGRAESVAALARSLAGKALKRLQQGI
jgi:hypothetical protein